jgi:hypothetical protein
MLGRNLHIASRKDYSFIIREKKMHITHTSQGPHCMLECTKMASSGTGNFKLANIWSVLFNSKLVCTVCYFEVGEKQIFNLTFKYLYL